MQVKPKKIKKRCFFKGFKPLTIPTFSNITAKYLRFYRSFNRKIVLIFDLTINESLFPFSTLVDNSNLHMPCGGERPTGLLLFKRVYYRKTDAKLQSILLSTLQKLSLKP